MIPSNQYFEYDDNIDSVGIESDNWYLTTSILGSSPLNLTTYDQTFERLCGIVQLNSNHIADAQLFHRSLYNPNHITQSVETYYLIGYGSTTPMRYEFDNNSWSCSETYTLGDGWVPIHSASLGERNPTETYYIQTGHESMVSLSCISLK